VGPSVQTEPEPRSSLESGTKLVTAPGRGWWRFRLFPDAGEAAGSFSSGSSWWDDEPGPAVWPVDSRDVAARRARSQVRRYCAANRLNRLGTLTYAGEGQHDPLALRRDVGAFFRGLRRDLGRALPYLWVPEWHPGGHGLHVHFAVGRYIAQGTIKQRWGRGHVHIKLLGNLPVGSGSLGEARLAARYLSKYLAKDLDEGGQPVGRHRYDVAEGFQPRSIELVGDTKAEVLAQAVARMGAEPVEVWQSSDQPDWPGPPSVWAQWA
jgi:hypothetical protein